VRSVAQSLLASREPWAEQFLAAVDAGQIEPGTISEATVRKLQLHASPKIAELCRKHWKSVAGTPLEELRTQIEGYLAMLGKQSGDPYPGKKIFSESCGKCHRLFGQGGQIGPELTAFKRDDVRGLLLNVVHPSAEIREGFEQYIARTADGRTLSGFIADQDAQVLVLRGVDGQSISLARDEVEDLRAIPQSLMPENILKPFSDQQIRDLFAYLRSTQPLP
jgi:putative heme-binding domain-containing protein